MSAEKTSTTTSPFKQGIRFIFDKEFDEETRNQFKDVANKYFSDMIPDSHKINVRFDSSIEEYSMEAPDANTILVHPLMLNINEISRGPGDIFGSTIGHELWHIYDHINYGGKIPDNMRAQSEVMASQWQLDTAQDFQLNIFERSHIQDYKNFHQRLHDVQQFMR